MIKTAAVYEADNTNSGPIRYMLNGDVETLAIQVLPEGCALAFTDVLGVQSNSHSVVNGEVVSTAP